MTEQEFSTQTIERLRPYFDIRHEWWGTCFGKRVRIDALLKPNDLTEWKNKDIILGVEFKRIDDNLKYKAVAQCIDYSYAEWDGLGRIPIFLCPGIPGNNLSHIERQKYYYPIAQLLCQFNVGELLETKHGLTLQMAGANKIWSERRSGVFGCKTWNFKPKSGSR